MTITLKPLEDSVQWDTILERCPHRTIHHTWRWLKLVEKHAGSKLVPLAGFNGSTPIGLFPIFVKKKGFARLALSPPPGGGLLYLGPVLAGYEALKQDKKESLYTEFVRAADRFIFSELKAGYARMRTVPGLIDSRPYKWNGYSVEPYYTYLVDLSKGIDAVWEDYNSQVRKDIRKTEKEGVRIIEGGREDIELIHGALAKRFREQGMESNIPKAYLYDLYDALHPQNLNIYLAKQGGEYLGGQITLSYGGRSSLWIGVARSEKKGVYPNELLQWEMMKIAAAKGDCEYEITCAGDDLRLRHFKSKFNPAPGIWYSAEKYSSGLYRTLKQSYGILRGMR